MGMCFALKYGPVCVENIIGSRGTYQECIMVSIRKLAQLAGVSHITVSRALRDDPHVAPKTKARIHTLAAQYAYHHNRAAQHVLNGTSCLLGCLLPSFTESYHSRMLSGVMARAFEENYQVVVLETQYDPLLTQKALHVLIEHRVAGVLIGCGQEVPIPREILLALRSHDISIVNVNNSAISMPADSVSTDEHALNEMAVRYLIHMGHRRIGYLDKYPRNQEHIRAQKFLQILQYFGVENLHLTLPQFEEILRCGPSRSQAITALVTLNDPMAFQALHACWHYNWQVPENLSILGFGNYDGSEYAHPPITTIEQHPWQLGKTAVDTLLARINGDAYDEPRHCYVPFELIIRQSCGPPFSYQS